MMHGELMEAQPPMGPRGDSGDGDVRSYQVPSKAQGEAGDTCDGRMKSARGCMEVHEAVHKEMKCAQGGHGGAWRCMGHQQHG